MKSKLTVVGLAGLLLVSGLTSCGDTSKTISVCASELPHAQILNESVKPILEKEGYTLQVKVLDWTMQNDSVYSGDYDANYFQHIPYLDTYNPKEDKVFAVAKVHYEPLRIYAGKASVTYTDSKATFEICNDTSNGTRALDLLVANGVISSYEKDSDGNADFTKLPSNITAVTENLLVASLPDYDYGLLPCNTAMTGNIDGNSEANKDLPTESETLASAKANVLAANTSKYKNDSTYKTKIDVLADALLSTTVKDYIDTTWKGVVLTYQEDLRTK